MSDTFERLKAALANRYAIEHELGAGGMATVYLAEDLKHERKVAVKVLRPDLAAVLGVERFLREVRIEANLSHPHILPLYDSGEADGFLYYVMPYVDGESLRDKLSREGELPIAEAVRILREVADALSHAHEQGVVHRDIKPDNVMLSGRHAMVTDFGVAKAVSQATGREQLTTAGVAIGTAAYMAPEQAAADPNVDHRADIYAFGVLAYEMLTGRPPFTGTSPQMVLSPEEHAQIEAPPTDNLEAYEYYLGGNEYAGRGYAEEHIRSAIQMYQRATDVDPDFALAYAERSTAHTRMWWFAYDRTDERMAMAREDIERAVALDSTSGEVRRGLGTYYYRTRDYERALTELESARRALPSDPEVISTMAAIKRRQGRFVEAARDFELVLELDPLSPTWAADLGNTYFFLRRYEDAERMMARGINLGPDSWPEWYALRSWVFLSWKSSTAESRRALEDGEARLPDDDRLWTSWVQQNLFERNYDEALGRLASRANDVFEAQFWYVVGHELLGITYALLARDAEARTHYDSAIMNALHALDPRTREFEVHWGERTPAWVGRKTRSARAGPPSISCRYR